MLPKTSNVLTLLSKQPGNQERASIKNITLNEGNKLNPANLLELLSWYQIKTIEKQKNLIISTYNLKYITSISIQGLKIFGKKSPE